MATSSGCPLMVVSHVNCSYIFGLVVAYDGLESHDFRLEPQCFGRFQLSNFVKSLQRLPFNKGCVDCSHLGEYEPCSYQLGNHILNFSLRKNHEI